VNIRISKYLSSAGICSRRDAEKLIVENLLSSKKIKNTKKLYLMTTNKKLFYSQFDFKEVTSQNLLIHEI